MSASHLNQKPLDLVTRLIQTCTVPGDTVWEPFGGLCTAMVAAVELDRMAFGSELDPYFAMLARERLEATSANRLLPVANAPAPDHQILSK
jgi:DNA modification methylase